ncbi:VOC family protein [Terriglobus sp. 2YAB30_2]|jgi:predicted enzyme related to lactoylglutathione lyase|uniref:VOC family protein n=1 Tax=Terriglobus TaxID=392733 RepID=UPI0021DFEC73|nr:VOC family protein [Terriglobus albidus]
MSERPQSAATWFEIPTLSIERAQAFYEQVLEMNMQSFPDENPMVVFPKDPAGTGGALVQREFQKPCDSGTVVYLSCKGDLAPVLERVKAKGGSILIPKTEITGGFGFFACIRDTEGNTVGLHSTE